MNYYKVKNDYGDGGIFYGLFLATKIKYCLTINEYGLVEEHKTFKGFSDIERLLDSKKYFDMQQGKKLLEQFSSFVEKISFETGVIIPSKTRDCENCIDSILCEECKLKTKQVKEFEANLNELKRRPPDKNGYMLPYYIVK